MANTTTTTTPTVETFSARVSIGSLTSRGIFKGFETRKGKTFAVFQGKIQDSLIGLEDKLIGGAFALNQVESMTLEQVEAYEASRIADMASFYASRPDLLND
jgi:hypothetical protein